MVIIITQGIKFDESSQRVRCLAHIINLSCQDALSALESIKCPSDGYNSDSDSDSGSEGEYDNLDHGSSSVYNRVKF